MSNNVIRGMWDGLTSLVSGMGTDRDKAASLFRVVDSFTDVDAYTLYETSALARNIVDLPAIDSCREWRDWQAEADQIELIEAEENRLNLRGKVLQARKWARLFGGSALFIGTGESAVDKPLVLDRVGQGGLKYVTVIDKTHLSSGEIERDPASEYYGLPKFYRLVNKEGGSVDIHPSRLAIFTGNERPYNMMTTNSYGFGSSILGSIRTTVDQADGTAANIASLVFEAKIDVISIPDMMNRIQDPRYEAQLTTRFGLAARMKGINGTLLLDAGEVYDQKTASFATLPDILNSFLQLVAGAARMPATVLLGQAPQGMNATGEGDYKNYLDRIASEQTLYMTPTMSKLDECLIRSAIGSRDPSVNYTWSPLWHSSEKEKAEVAKIYADTARQIVGATPGNELIVREAMSEALINRYVEDGTFPGLEAAIEEYGSLDEQAPTEEEQLALEMQKVNLEQAKNPQPALKLVSKDAAPRSLYVRRDVINSAEIVRWAKSQGFTDIQSDLHVTITYSTTPVDWFQMGTSWEDRIEIAPGGPRLMEKFGDATVLLISSNNLKWRNEEMRDLGASFDHEEYQPHITIQYGFEGNLDGIAPYQGRIVLGPEIFEEVKQDTDV